MTREEFFERLEVECSDEVLWELLSDFDLGNRYDLYVYTYDDMINAIMEYQLQDAVNNWDFESIKSAIERIPDRYNSGEYYLGEGVLEYRELTFGEFRDAVLEAMDYLGDWDEDEEDVTESDTDEDEEHPELYINQKPSEPAQDTEDITFIEMLGYMTA